MGRVLLAVHRSLPSRQIASPSHLEIVCVDELCTYSPLLFCAVYMPPISPFELYSEVCCYLKYLTLKIILLSLVTLFFQTFAGPPYLVNLHHLKHYVLPRGKRSTSTMTHEVLSDVFCKLSPKMKKRYLDKIARIKNDDPYAGKG